MVKNLNISTKNVDEYSKSIIAYYKNVEAAQKDSQKTTKQAVDDQLGMLLQLDEYLKEDKGESFVGLYKGLSLLRQADFLTDLDKVQKKIEKMGEAAQNLGLTTAQVNAQIAYQYRKFYFTFKRTEGDKVRVMRETFDAMAEDLLKFAGKEQEAEEKRAAIAKNARDAKINIWEDEKKRAAALVESEKVYQGELLNIDKKYFDKRMDLYSKLSDLYSKTIDDREAKELSKSADDFRRLRERANVEIKEQKILSEYLIMLEGTEKDERLRIIAAFEEARRKEKEKADRELYRPFLREGREEERQRKRARRLEKDLVRLRLESSRKWLANHTKTVEEYLEILDDAYGQGLLSHEEYMERKMAVEGTWLEQFRFGLDSAIVQMRTWGEFIIDVGKSISEQISSGFASAFMEFVEGTKTAREAFEDFAESVIDWLLEMIVKQYLFNAIAGIVRGYGGRGVSTPAPAVAGAGPTSPITRQHGGWITEPVVGLGVRSKRPYTIAEKGPEYVSKGGGPSTGSVKVIVNNNTGTEAKAKSTTSYDSQGLIVTVVLDALNRNKMGFRDSIRGVR